MIVGNKEKTVRLHAENFLWGNITFDYGITEEERFALAKTSSELSSTFRQWLKEDEKDSKSEEHKKTTAILFNQIVSGRIRGRIKGQLRDIDLEARIEDLVREKSKLEEEIKQNKTDIIKAINEIKDRDRTIA